MSPSEITGLTDRAGLINVVPNPTIGSLTIENNSGLKIEKIEICNVLGQKVYSAANLPSLIDSASKASNTIDVHSLATGIYNAQIVTSNGIINKRLVVEYSR